jgi:hypothetical protein
MNTYFAITILLGEEGRRFSQEFRLHPQFPVLPLQLLQPGPFRYRERRFLVGMVHPIRVHPVPEGALVHADLPGHLGDRTRCVDYQLHGLVLELGRKLSTPFRHR